MEVPISCGICDTIFNHTELYEYRHGKMLMHLKFTFEALSEIYSPGEYMQYFRQLRGFTTRQLAEKLNIVLATVLGYEHGRFPILYEIAKSLAAIFEVPRVMLFDDYCVFIGTQYQERLHAVRKSHGLN